MESVKATLRLLELVVEHGELGVSELARSVNEPKSTVQRGLTSLYEAGWLTPVTLGARRRWRPSSKLAALASRLDPTPTIRRAAADAMRRLGDATGETIHLMLREGDEVVLIERLDSTHVLRIVRPLGARAPLHLASNGKAILAHLTAAETDRYLDLPLAAWTSRSITAPDSLRAELATIRTRGFAYNDGELDLDVRALAAPIFDDAGAPIAALSISCPASRLDEAMVAERGRLVAAAAADITELLNQGASGAS